MTIADRIKFLRKSLKLKQAEFGERISYKRGYVANLETSGDDIHYRVIEAICREFQVSEKWLRTGEGDMFAPSSPITANDLDIVQKWLIEKVRQLDTQSQNEIADVCRMIVERIEKEKNAKKKGGK